MALNQGAFDTRMIVDGQPVGAGGDSATLPEPAGPVFDQVVTTLRGPIAEQCVEVLHELLGSANVAAPSDHEVPAAVIPVVYRDV